MNYFAHGRNYIEDPYFLAGTAIPDWLSVVDRRVRARGKNAEKLIADNDPRTAAIARGIVQHHFDDRWFHQTRACSDLCWQFTVEIRDCLPTDDSLRVSFLGHILVELLLDATLIEEDHSRIEKYYQAIGSIDPQVVQDTVNQIAAQKTNQLTTMIGRFFEVRFLLDYLDDAKLLYRLNQVMQRVRLPEIPTQMLAILPRVRKLVKLRKKELLFGPAAAP